MFFSKVLNNPDDISEEDINRLSEQQLNGRQVSFYLLSGGFFIYIPIFLQSFR
jgi:hypothetical protein